MSTGYKILGALVILLLALGGGLYLSGFVTLLLLQDQHMPLQWNTYIKYVQVIGHPGWTPPYVNKIKLAGAIGCGIPLMAWLVLLIPLFKRTGQAPQSKRVMPKVEIPPSQPKSKPPDNDGGDRPRDPPHSPPRQQPQPMQQNKQPAPRAFQAPVQKTMPSRAAAPEQQLPRWHRWRLPAPPEDALPPDYGDFWQRQPQPPERLVALNSPEAPIEVIHGPRVRAIMGRLAVDEIIPREGARLSSLIPVHRASYDHAYERGLLRMLKLANEQDAKRLGPRPPSRPPQPKRKPDLSRFRQQAQKGAPAQPVTAQPAPGPAINPAKLKAAAEHLEWVLGQYPNEPAAQELYQSLQPLIGNAKAGEISQPVDGMNIPGAYNLVAGIYRMFDDPNIENAYILFVTLMEGKPV